MNQTCKLKLNKIIVESMIRILNLTLKFDFVILTILNITRLRISYNTFLIISTPLNHSPISLIFLSFNFPPYLPNHFFPCFLLYFFFSSSFLL